MAQAEWLANEIEVAVSGFFTTHHRLETAAGSLGEFTFSAFRMHAVFCAADGREMVARQVAWWRSQHELLEGDAVLATARPPSFWSRALSVGFGGQEYALKSDFWGRRWRLTDEAGTALLEIRPRGVFRRGAYLTVQDAVDADLLAFTYYLVHVRWEERHTAGAAAAGGS
jgi:hypothetical protein